GGGRRARSQRRGPLLGWSRVWRDYRSGRGRRLRTPSRVRGSAGRVSGTPAGGVPARTGRLSAGSGVLELLGEHLLERVPVGARVLGAGLPLSSAQSSVVPGPGGLVTRALFFGMPSPRVPVR